MPDAVGVNTNVTTPPARPVSPRTVPPGPVTVTTGANALDRTVTVCWRPSAPENS